MGIRRLKQTKGLGHNGTRILVSTVQYPNGLYETIVLNEMTYSDLAILSGRDYEGHKKAHQEFVKKFCVSIDKKEVGNVPQKYKDFAKDYIEVIRLLQQDPSYKELKDGGTSNFDSPIVYLKGYREDYLQEAIKEHSTVLGVSRCGRGRFTLRIPRNSSQGQHRTYQARYIAKALEEKGYTTTVDYILD